MKSSHAHLNRSLGLFSAICIVSGTVIGTGIFLKPAIMAQHAGSIAMVLTAWAVAGLLSYTGALTYAELGSVLPEAGGEYVYLKEAYGDFPAYMYGFMRFIIGAPGSIASYAVGGATFLHVIIPYTNMGIKIWQLAIFFIVLFTLINCITVLVSAAVQNTLTVLKITSILVIVSLLYLYSGVGTESSPPVVWPGITSFSAALMAALWAYDGWNNLPMLAGELRNAKRNLPLALATGMLVVLGVYLVTNLAYFKALNWGTILNANSSLRPDAQPVANIALSATIGSASALVAAGVMLLSALGAMNGSVVSGARVPYAMANDGLFFRKLADISPRNHVPVKATLVQGLIASILAASGSFDQLTDSVVFASWMFYGLTAATIFRFRKKFPHQAKFRTPWYPVLPLVFVLMAAILVVNTVIAQPGLSLIGIACMALGIPLYFLFHRKA